MCECFSRSISLSVCLSLSLIKEFLRLKLVKIFVLFQVIADKHEDMLAKLGAILAQGIIDAGGRNMTVSLQSRTGHTNMMAVVGMLVGKDIAVL